MQKTLKNLKILLIQSRLEEQMREHELAGFIKYSELRKEQFNVRSITDEKFNLDDVLDFDAVIIGGTGDFEVPTVREKYPQFYAKLERLARECREQNIPILSICMQYLPVFFGGVAEKDLNKKEVGTYTIKLTEEGKADKLFSFLPNEFKAQVGHKDYVSRLPEGAVLLAYSDKCPTHAYKVGEKEYFLQFHPELDKEGVIYRVNAYPSYAKDDPEEYRAVMSGLDESPEANTFLRHWIEKIVLS